MAKLRLNKILAQAGLTSRRGADRLILEGRVAINGDVVHEAGTVADPDRDHITVDGPAVPLAVSLERTSAEGSRLHLTFGEGRKHEVKRYCEALGHPVRRLRRVGFGPIALGRLRVGSWRSLTAAEVRALRAAASAPPPGERRTLAPCARDGL